MKVLVVCVGNQCRSPLAERLLQTRLDAVRPGLATVGSAGTHARPGTPMDQQSARELVRLGADPAGFAARRVTAELIAEQDLVLAATRGIRTDVLGVSPRMLKRAFTLPELAMILRDAPGSPGRLDELAGFAAEHRARGAQAPDVPDPIGASDEVHREVADQISAAVDDLVAVAVRLG